MTNTTPDYWDADGTSLQTYVQNLEQWGTRHGVPALRGADLLVPFVPGEDWQEKVPGPTNITLAGWVIGDSELEFKYNWREFRRLLWRTDRQVALTKRWRSLDGLTSYSATAMAEHQGGMQPDTFGVQGGKFTCDMKLAFPYFKGATVDAGVHSDDFSVDNIGDDTTRLITLGFSAAATLTNVTSGRALTVPDAATVVVGSFSTTGNYENISVTGRPHEEFWFHLLRGVNSLHLSTGTVSVSYTPLYL